ncbi:MAG: hypothetical protein ACP5C3_05270 [Methanomicrobiales archaeon]
MENICYENYPFKIVFLSNLLTLSIYIIGTYILYNLTIIFALLYLIYALFLEIRLLKKSCVNCYYYGKICGFGKGRLSYIFFKKGDNSKFSLSKIGWKDMIPDLMIILLPLIGGIFILIFNFSWIILLLILALLALSTVGNAVIRGNFACKYCKQRKLGCPAENLFDN